MSHTQQIIGAILLLSALSFTLWVRKAKTVDPKEKEKEEEFDENFDERIIYMDYEDFLWKKKRAKTK